MYSSTESFYIMRDRTMRRVYGGKVFSFWERRRRSVLSGIYPYPYPSGVAWQNGDNNEIGRIPHSHIAKCRCLLSLHGISMESNRMLVRRFDGAVLCCAGWLSVGFI